MPNKERAMSARYRNFVELCDWCWWTFFQFWFPRIPCVMSVSVDDFTKSKSRIKMLSSSVRFFSRFHAQTRVLTSGKKRKNKCNKQKYSWFGMIGLDYCAQAGLERLCRMEVSHHKQSHLHTKHWHVHILQLRNAEINVEKIITVKCAT